MFQRQTINTASFLGVTPEMLERTLQSTYDTHFQDKACRLMDQMMIP